MDDWVWWMIAAGVLAVGEIATLGFFLGPIAIAAVLAALAALTGAGPAIQLVVFIVASVATLVFIRPVAVRHLKTPPRIRTGAAALIGQGATVLEATDGSGGQVKIGGEVWSARAFDEDERYEPGDRVEVLKIEGATALVHK